MPRFLETYSSFLTIFSNARNVDTKKVIKQNITIPVNIKMSKFFIYFFNLRLKNIKNPIIVGGHKPIKTAFSKFS